VRSNGQPHPKMRPTKRVAAPLKATAKTSRRADVTSNTLHSVHQKEFVCDKQHPRTRMPTCPMTRYLALTFSTLLSSQGSGALLEPTSRPFSGQLVLYGAYRMKPCGFFRRFPTPRGHGYPVSSLRGDPRIVRQRVVLAGVRRRSVRARRRSPSDRLLN
jgi:hypothetical protein